MKNWQDMMRNQTFRYLDHTAKTTFNHDKYTALTSFAIDDALTLSVSDQLSPPTMRLWVHPKTIVLGIPDARLPYINEGVTLLKNEGYSVIVRNSGGLAVALDQGVLNMSLIIPNVRQISIHDSYEWMYQFITYLLRDVASNIQAYEIVGSYCPGDYDLSIDGIKFAGISQRRIKNGAAIQIYIDIENTSKERTELVKRFYEISLQNEKTTFTYPTINPNVMGSLTEILRKKITIDEIKSQAQAILKKLCEQVVTTPFSKKELTTFEKRLKQMKVRNKDIRKILL